MLSKQMMSPVPEESERLPCCLDGSEPKQASQRGASLSKVDLIIRLQRARKDADRAHVLHYLIKHGFKDTDVNCKKRTCLGLAYTRPLHVAAKNLDAEMVSKLLKCGADATAMDSSGCTAQQFLLKSLHGRHPMVQPSAKTDRVLRLFDAHMCKRETNFTSFTQRPASKSFEDSEKNLKKEASRAVWLGRGLGALSKKLWRAKESTRACI
eukprot:TRINITY_DN4429_c0_g2_i1.p1 TRINITY_DN4429_c0_g2~~TRINITY_DN4429_c0_g2_i1.p1  ORF type:complete len:210 (+),score=32.49 TRINITY_DN4429_c0_g2_i1:63-692(+)